MFAATSINIFFTCRDTDEHRVQMNSTGDSDCTDEPLPRLSRDTFIEALNEIEDIN